MCVVLCGKMVYTCSLAPFKLSGVAMTTLTSKQDEQGTYYFVQGPTCDNRDHYSQ